MHVFIMKILVFHNYVLYKFYIFISSMERKTRSKLNSSNMLPSDREGLKNYSVISRHNSFSSCSNDSSVCSSVNNRIQTRFGNAKPIVNQSTNIRKRTRNSSGSSLSSNVSCISDKDLKSSEVISQTLTKTEMNNCNDTDVTHLSYSKVNTCIEDLKKEAMRNKEFDHSKNSLIILPNTHNLRGKITKKGCTCCPSACATVVVRHYKKYVTTEEKMLAGTKSESKTVISNTRVKTYVQQNSTNVPPEDSSELSTRSRTKKRRSEIEKLYDSLHEIEWAKNFSPDNILRQINVRQAASCSAFGRSSNNMEDMDRSPKRRKLFNDVSDIKSSVDTKSKLDSEDEEPSKSKTISSLNKEICSMANCKNKQKIVDFQALSSNTLNACCEQNYKSCNSHSSVNTTSCSMSRFVKEININSVKSICNDSLIKKNGAVLSDDAQLLYTSDESSSAMSSSIVNLQSKHLLDYAYQDKRDLAKADFSVTPTFLDIAEEGIRTIDACFREVGAEVIVSTCYEDSKLPLLTPMKEGKAPSKVLEEPPTLEPCVTVEFDCNVKDALSEIFNKQFDFKSCSQFSVTSNKIEKVKSKTFYSKDCNYQNNVQQFSFKKYKLLSCQRPKIVRKIIKKYVRQSWSKTKLRHLVRHKTKKCVFKKNKELPNISHKQSCKMNKHLETKKDTSLTNYQSSVLSSAILKPDEPTCVIFNKKTNSENFNQNTDKVSQIKTEEKTDFHSSKESSCLHDIEKITKNSSEAKKQSNVSQSSDYQFQPVSTSGSSNFENDDKSLPEHISRPVPSLMFSSQYKSIRVNRSYNYTHIILLITRGKSIFLTLETLRELRDAVIRTNNDSSCPVLVLNGVGDAFCLGLDLKPLVGPRKKIASTEMAIAIKELIEALSDFRKPLAAVVNGPALGLGMTLLNHVDYTIASEKATFCMPHSFLGYMPEGGATLTLPQIVGSTVAMDLLLRGRTLTAREACNVGLITEVLEPKLLPQELVSRIRVLAQNSLCALENTKTLLKMQLHINLRIILEHEVKLLPRMWLTRTCQDSLRKALQSGILSD